LRRILRWVIGLPIAIFVVGFAIANRRFVTLSFDPFTQTNPSVFIDLPLWILFFVGILVGLFVGWIGAWFAQGKHRKAAKESRNEVGRLQAELSEARKANQQESPAQDVVPFNGGFL
jgi:H+/Cl- antiporter ClcA